MESMTVKLTVFIRDQTPTASLYVKPTADCTLENS